MSITPGGGAGQTPGWQDPSDVSSKSQNEKAGSLGEHKISSTSSGSAPGNEGGASSKTSKVASGIFSSLGSFFSSSSVGKKGRSASVPASSSGRIEARADSIRSTKSEGDVKELGDASFTLEDLKRELMAIGERGKSSSSPESSQDTSEVPGSGEKSYTLEDLKRDLTAIGKQGKVSAQRSQSVPNVSQSGVGAEKIRSVRQVRSEGDLSRIDQGYAGPNQAAHTLRNTWTQLEKEYPIEYKLTISGVLAQDIEKKGDVSQKKAGLLVMDKKGQVAIRKALDKVAKEIKEERARGVNDVMNSFLHFCLDANADTDFAQLMEEVGGNDSMALKGLALHLADLLGRSGTKESHRALGVVMKEAAALIHETRQELTAANREANFGLVGRSIAQSQALLKEMANEVPGSDQQAKKVIVDELF